MTELLGSVPMFPVVVTKLKKFLETQNIALKTKTATKTLPNNFLTRLSETSVCGANFRQFDSFLRFCDFFSLFNKKKLTQKLEDKNFVF